MFKIRSLKAKADARRSVTERMADRVVTASGTFLFLSINVVWFLGWLTMNSGILGNVPFDPYPFVMLTTVVSIEAIILAIFVLISQNRAAKIADLREEVDLQMDVITEKEITKALEILSLMAKKQKIDLSGDGTLAEMLKDVDRDRIEQILEDQADGE